MLRKFFKFFQKKQPSSKNLEAIIQKSVRNGAKDVLTGSDSLSFEGKQKLIKQEINKKARSILKDSIEKPEVLLNFVNAKGTVIVKSKYMERILWLFGETEGFITPMSGFKAFLFTLVINQFSLTKLKVGFKTPAMFALKDEPVNIYTLAHQFHLWLSYINNLPGFEEKTMKNFKNFWKTGHESDDLGALPIDDVFSLKDIIAREMEALNFVQELGRELFGAKESLKKLKEGKSLNL